MAETVTRPVRGAAARSQAAKAAKEAAAKTETAKTDEKPAEAPKAETKTETKAPEGARTVVALEHVNDTKNWSVWKPPAGLDMVGSIYAPLGTTEVRVLAVGPAE